jgi:hypothetical protein
MADCIDVFVGLAARPEKRSASSEMLRSDGAKVAAVEACRILCEKEEVSRLECPATMPARHMPPDAVLCVCEGRKSAADKNVSAKPADTISRDGHDGFQEIRGARQISSTVG